VKYGGGFLYKDRDFTEEQYRFNNNTGQYGGVPSIYFADTNLLGNERPIDPINRNGVFVSEFREPGNTYNASQSVANAYVSAELPLKENLKLIAGARYEYTNISLLNQADDTASLINNDILPAITLNWGVNEKMNLRWAYSRTLARPTFRELAPYASFDFIGDFILVGNNDLERTLIDNADFRFEFYPNYGELIAVGLFYKHFNNPIERTFNIQAVNPELTYRNVDAAHLAGIEFEMRKNLGFISPKLENFSFGFNASYIYSRVDIDSLELVAIRALNPDASSTRQMFGQSPFLINLLISYQNQKGTSANLAFNIQGRQISVIGFKGNPNVFQMPIPNLNFTFDQELKKGWSIRFKAQNLLNAVDVEKQFLTAEVDDSPGEILKTEYVFQRAQFGVDLSVGVRYIIK
jgi:TonB-dependent receptor